MKEELIVISFVLVIAFPLFDNGEEIMYSFNDDIIGRYLPLFGNNISLAEEIYAREVTQGENYCIEYIFYYSYQTGHFRYDSHDWDYEWIIVFIELPIVDYVTFDKWHYVVGREPKNGLTTINTTHTLFYCNSLYRYFRPTNEVDDDTNITIQIEQNVEELTNSVLQKAEDQVGLDKSLFDDPFSWKYPSLFGHYTAWKSIKKGFFSWLDYNFDFIDLRAPRSFGYKLA